MSTYLDWGHKQISGNDPIEAAILYDQGYLFTRKFKGDMYRSRSVRIVLADFYLSSENKRVLKKTEVFRKIVFGRALLLRSRVCIFPCGKIFLR